MGKKRKNKTIKEEKTMENNEAKETETVIEEKVEEIQNGETVEPEVTIELMNQDGITIADQEVSFIIDEPVDTVTVTEEATKEEDLVIPEDNGEPQLEAILGGIVNGCDRLNIRKEPSMDAEIVDVLDKNTVVNVDVNLSTEDFYKVNVYNETKIVDGYCLKKFITLE